MHRRARAVQTGDQMLNASGAGSTVVSVQHRTGGLVRIIAIDGEAFEYAPNESVTLVGGT